VVSACTWTSSVGAPTYGSAAGARRQGGGLLQPSHVFAATAVTALQSVVS
jgi:hypothetical protein